MGILLLSPVLFVASRQPSVAAEYQMTSTYIGMLSARSTAHTVNPPIEAIRVLQQTNHCSVV